MSKQESKGEAKSDETVVSSLRPVGLSISSFFYAVSGLYYLSFPIVVSDPTVWPLYVLGALSLLGSFGLLKMSRWGLWLGLGLFLPQVIVAASALQTAFQYPGLSQSLIGIVFVVSLVILIIFASLTFLLILDKRRSFK